ncbi:MAG: hypothetical protein IPP73_10290 [Chitinophagaceae bacterium]|nr:hypothetical protein [Chitinophagaceae bacterium]
MQKGLNPSLDIQEDNETLIASAKRFYMANAAPREIREALIASIGIVPGDLEISSIEFASVDIIPSGNINCFCLRRLLCIGLLQEQFVFALVGRR